MAQRTWEETQRRHNEHLARMAQEAKARREGLAQLVDTDGWQAVIEDLAVIAREEYEIRGRTYARCIADGLDKLASELW